MRAKRLKEKMFVIAALAGVVAGTTGAVGDDGTANGATEPTATRQATAEKSEETKKVSLRDKFGADVYSDSDIFALTDMLSSNERFLDLDAARNRWSRVKQDVASYEFKDVELFKNYVASLIAEENLIAFVAQGGGRGITMNPSAKPFVCVWGKATKRGHFNRIANFYLSEAVDYSFVEAELRYPVVIACDPPGKSWGVWIETPKHRTDNTDLNFYNMTEELFKRKYDGKKKAGRLADLKAKAELQERIAENRAERAANAEERNAMRIGKQNSLILQSLYHNLRGGFK